MAVDVNRLPGLGCGKLRAFISDDFYYLSEVGSERDGRDLGGLGEQSLPKL